jgi:hypothetical protein
MWAVVWYLPSIHNATDQEGKLWLAYRMCSGSN